MNKVGLVGKDDDYFVPEIYACYERSIDRNTPEWDEAFRKVKDLRPCPPIRFIGVWDTVGALGAPGFLGQIFNRNKYRYHDVELNPHIENAYQALAIDERRSPFKPNLWTRPDKWSGNLEQVWFAGVHRNVGGGFTPDGLANEALHWIVEKAEGLGLEFDKDYLRPFKACFNADIENSMTMLYRLLGEYARPLGEHSADGEMVHRSAIDRKDLPVCQYRPKNLAALLASGQPVTLAETAGIPRGVPCPPSAMPPG
jgi:hypothetical protein